MRPLCGSRNTVGNNSTDKSPHPSRYGMHGLKQTSPPSNGCVVNVSAAIARGKRPVTFRTRKLRLSAPMVLQGGPCGRVGHRRTPFRNTRRATPAGAAFLRYTDECRVLAAAALLRLAAHFGRVVRHSPQLDSWPENNPRSTSVSDRDDDDRRGRPAHAPPRALAAGASSRWSKWPTVFRRSRASFGDRPPGVARPQGGRSAEGRPPADDRPEGARRRPPSAWGSTRVG